MNKLQKIASTEASKYDDSQYVEYSSNFTTCEGERAIYSFKHAGYTVEFELRDIFGKVGITFALMTEPNPVMTVLEYVSPCKSFHNTTFETLLNEAIAAAKTA